MKFAMLVKRLDRQDEADAGGRSTNTVSMARLATASVEARRKRTEAMRWPFATPTKSQSRRCWMPPVTQNHLILTMSVKHQNLISI